MTDVSGYEHWGSKANKLWKPRVPVHSVVSLSTSSATLLAANLARKAALIMNDHASNIVYITLENTTAVANTGIRINNAGGSYMMSLEAGNLSTSIIKGISTGATTPVLITEWT